MNFLRSSVFAVTVSAILLAGSGCKTKPKNTSLLNGGDGSNNPNGGMTAPGGVDPNGFGALPPRGGGIKQVPGNGGAVGDAYIVYFAFDRSNIGDTERGKVTAVADILKGHPEWAVQIEGNCDERGSDEYNRGLGEKRALAVRDAMVADGVADTRIDTLSNGEEKPAVPNAKGEEEFAKNRRAEFVIGTREAAAPAAGAAPALVP